MLIHKTKTTPNKRKQAQESTPSIDGVVSSTPPKKTKTSAEASTQKPLKVEKTKVKKPEGVELGPALLWSLEPIESGNSSPTVTVLKVTNLLIS